MSYPDPTYFGNGDVLARYRPAAMPPDLPLPGGSASYLATGATTDGRFGLYRWDMGPEPAGAQPHFHRTISESFFVVSGTVQLFDMIYVLTGGGPVHSSETMAITMFQVGFRQFEVGYASAISIAVTAMMIDSPRNWTISCLRLARFWSLLPC